VVFAFKAPVACVPLVGMAPDQPPDAVHEVAFVAVHFTVELAPLATVLGLALMLTVGAVEADFSDTVAVWTALPPGPVQLKVKLFGALIAPVLWEPVGALLPDQAPEALHEVAFLADQVSVALLPLDTLLGVAPMVTTGAAEFTETMADWLALPPSPVQVST
jgi:hypothetical protein